MSRRLKAIRRPLPADPRYDSQTVSRFINQVMRRGKKSTAEGLVYKAMDVIEQRLGQPGVAVLKQALNNVKPVLEVKTRRVGGANYQVPVEVNRNRQTSLSLRWIIGYARGRSEKSMIEKLAAELLDAASNRGGAVKKRDDTHRMAEANKAFAHYRW